MWPAELRCISKVARKIVWVSQPWYKESFIIPDGSSKFPIHFRKRQPQVIKEACPNFIDFIICLYLYEVFDSLHFSLFWPQTVKFTFFTPCCFSPKGKWFLCDFFLQNLATCAYPQHNSHNVRLYFRCKRSQILLLLLVLNTFGIDNYSTIKTPVMVDVFLFLP